MCIPVVGPHSFARATRLPSTSRNATGVLYEKYTSTGPTVTTVDFFERPNASIPHFTMFFHLLLLEGHIIDLAHFSLRMVFDITRREKYRNIDCMAVSHVG